jgi:hypothetical protein
MPSPRTGVRGPTRCWRGWPPQRRPVDGARNHAGRRRSPRVQHAAGARARGCARAPSTVLRGGTHAQATAARPGRRTRAPGLPVSPEAHLSASMRWRGTGWRASGWRACGAVRLWGRAPSRSCSCVDPRPTAVCRPPYVFVAGAARAPAACLWAFLRHFMAAMASPCDAAALYGRKATHAQQPRAGVRGVLMTHAHARHGAAKCF